MLFGSGRELRGEILQLNYKGGQTRSWWFLLALKTMHLYVQI